MKTRFFLLLFLFVSMLDAFFTISLIRDVYITGYTLDSWEIGKEYHKPENMESNLLARQVLISYGVDGMIWYKGILLLIICISIFIVSKKYPRVSFSISMFAFILTAMVAAYGLVGLIVYHTPINRF